MLLAGNFSSFSHSRDPKSFTPFLREKGNSVSIEKSAIFLNREQIMPPKENRQLYQNSLKRNITRHYFLRNQRARSEMNMQELTVESADWLSVILNASNSTKRISHLIIRGERKIGSFQNWRMEIEELKKFSCAETKRAQQLRIDELS